MQAARGESSAKAAGHAVGLRHAACVQAEGGGAPRCRSRKLRYVVRVFPVLTSFEAESLWTGA